jgi:Mg2+-importing ATPase
MTIMKDRQNTSVKTLLRTSRIIKERMLFGASSTPQEIFKKYNTSLNGLHEKDVEEAREKYGRNSVTKAKEKSLLLRLIESFVSPFTAILIALAVVSACTDIIFAAPENRNYVTVIIITVMVLFSGILRFVQETRSGSAAAKLSSMIHTTTCIERIDDGSQERPLDEAVVGDIIHLSSGDMVPADVRIISAKDLFIGQAALTGESEPLEKTGEEQDPEGKTLTDISSLAFMGSTVISGSATAVILAVGNDTVLGSMAKDLSAKAPATSFEKGVNSVSWLLIRFMLVMVPIVFFVNGFTKGNWLEAAMFAISVAVGLTPEMLPMIVTTCLARGAVNMSHRKVIIKNLNSIQNLGSMDILCTDKTGTLTQDKVVLEYYLDIHGDENSRVLKHAFLNSYFQTGLKNLIDLAIINKEHQVSDRSLETDYRKVDEIPFDFNRRRMSVVVADKTGKTQVITKGAVEEMLQCCSYAEYEGNVVPLDKEIEGFILKKSDELNAQGMRVIAIAHKTNPAPVGQFSVSDETGMVLIGFLAFLDPPKETAASAIKALQNHGVSVKILTGDNEGVTACICSKVGLDGKAMLTGAVLDDMSDEELAEKAERTVVFAKLSPSQKARVIRTLREDGHTVGYMGDGINDASAMKASDVGISVDSAVDIAKESASVILLDKDLMVLEDGILEGRRTYANMIKYIKMTASSNFGNMFSVLAASAFLPFLPMAAIQLILLNLIYDFCCTAVPWDNVDPEYLAKPKKWDADSVGSFMLWIGPTSSVFDIMTYLIMYFIICPSLTGGQLYSAMSDPAMKAMYVALFQTGWFVESMWTQTLVVHMIRTPKIPFIQSRASKPLMCMTLAGIASAIVISYTPLGTVFGFTSLPPVYFAWLALIVICYMVLVTIVKKLYIHKHGALL